MNFIIPIIFIIILICVVVIYGCYNKCESFESSKVSNKDRKILILDTGGTITMVETPQGFSPKKDYLIKEFNKILDLYPKHKKDISEFDIIQYDPLLDSSNLAPKDWNKMITDIYDNYEKYDAFIILHGTDTMSYSASAISFALNNLSKTVIFTGSQIPLSILRNDAQNNLLCSLILASNYNIPEVLLVFANEIMRGNRTSKVSSNKLKGFACPNYTNLGAFGYYKYPQLNKKLIQNLPESKFFIKKYNEDYKVVIVFLTPGASFKSIKDSVANNPLVKGVILLTFGIGDGPVANKEFIDVLTFLQNKNIIVVNVSQCLEGRVDQDDYATGKILKNYDVISGQDITTEAAYTKLLYLLSIHITDITNEMKTNLRGELSNSLSLVNVDIKGL